METKARVVDHVDSRIGTRIGHFVIRAEIGRGGMGIVYRAEDKRLHRDVALKIIPGALMDETRRRRFFREARAAARINHPNVTTVFDAGEQTGDAYIAMEY
ncbi:MAG TPA: protein kinase, partial [Polyangium sp.]|nr:protein kinase [Polyangium sp.]